MTAPARADLDAALLLLSRLGITPSDLLSAVPSRPAAPTFAEYIPVVAEAVSAGTRRVYASYWNRILEQWGGRPVRLPPAEHIDGRGLFLVEHLCDRVEYRTSRSGTTVHLEMNI